MRRLLLAAIASFLAFTALPAAGAGPVTAGPTAGGLASDNVEFIRTVPIATDAVGGRLIGKYFYANDQNKVMIFDTSDPENPQLTGQVLMPQELVLSREDLDGNGSILIVPNLGSLHIVDVEDKTNPQVIATLRGAGQHTMSCVLDCSYAYGSGGIIVDLRDPANPKLVDRKWGDGKPAGSGHDVTEVSRGMILTATQPIMYMDARQDPTRPKLLAVGASDDGRFIHTSRWARGGKDKFLLMAGETNIQPRCSERNGAFMTWDATQWEKFGTFTMIDEYRVTNGTYADGKPAANVVGCSSHWHEAHPAFKNGGLVAAAFFEHGSRFIDVSSTGKIKEIGWFVPARGSTGAVYWRTPRILYALNYLGGIDVLKFTGNI